MEVIEATEVVEAGEFIEAGEDANARDITQCTTGHKKVAMPSELQGQRNF